MIFLVSLLAASLLLPHSQGAVTGQKEEDHTYWRKVNNNELQKSLSLVQNKEKAKNIILFIGDGMSLPTLTAGRIYKNQRRAEMNRNGESGGEEIPLTFETFPHVGLSRTYNTNDQISDSASTASAMATGVKTNTGTLGFDNSVKRGDGKSQKEAKQVESILKWAQDSGKDTGLVTNTRLTHATPAGFYAHSADRNWECDTKIPEDQRAGIHDIAYQAVHSDPGRRLKLLMGGGGKAWKVGGVNNDNKRENIPRPVSDFNCERIDPTEDLTKAFLKKQDSVPGFEGAKGRLLKNYKELKAASKDLSNIDYVLGLFSDTFMSFDTENSRQSDDREPDLVEMTEFAIQLLSKNSSNGFFLMIEGGLLDLAHHYGEANNALHETMMLDNAVEKALDLVDTKETLIIVTSDHGHTMSYTGYVKRGGDIRGFSKYLADDGKPYNLLSYANGIGFKTHFTATNDEIIRKTITLPESLKPNYVNPATIETDKEWHSGADVGIFAIGPWSHLVHSVHEQTYINTVMAYSACLGEYSDEPHCSGSNTLELSFILIAVSFIYSQCI